MGITDLMDSLFRDRGKGPGAPIFRSAFLSQHEIPLVCKNPGDDGDKTVIAADVMCDVHKISDKLQKSSEVFDFLIGRILATAARRYGRACTVALTCDFSTPFWMKWPTQCHRDAESSSQLSQAADVITPYPEGAAFFDDGVYWFDSDGEMVHAPFSIDRIIKTGDRVTRSRLMAYLAVFAHRMAKRANPYSPDPRDRAWFEYFPRRIWIHFEPDSIVEIERMGDIGSGSPTMRAEIHKRNNGFFDAPVWPAPCDKQLPEIVSRMSSITVNSEADITSARWLCRLIATSWPHVSVVVIMSLDGDSLPICSRMMWDLVRQNPRLSVLWHRKPIDISRNGMFVTEDGMVVDIGHVYTRFQEYDGGYTALDFIGLCVWFGTDFCQHFPPRNSGVNVRPWGLPVVVSSRSEMARRLPVWSREQYGISLFSILAGTYNPAVPQRTEADGAFFVAMSQMGLSEMAAYVTNCWYWWNLETPSTPVNYIQLAASLARESGMGRRGLIPPPEDLLMPPVAKVAEPVPKVSRKRQSRPAAEEKKESGPANEIAVPIPNILLGIRTIRRKGVELDPVEG